MNTQTIARIVSAGGCVTIDAASSSHQQMDSYGKELGFTVVHAPWHPNPDYRIWKTGSLEGATKSDRENFPSGLVIVDETGIPHAWANRGID